MPILVDDAGRCIDHQNAHIGAVDGFQRADRGIFINGFIDFAALYQSRGVNRDETVLSIFEWGIDGISRRPGKRIHDDARFAENRVGQRRFADIRPPDKAEGDLTFIGFFFLVRQIGNDFIQEIADADAMRARHREGVAQTQCIEFGRIGEAIDIIDFIDRQNDGFVALIEHARDLLIIVVQSGPAVDHENDDIRFVDSDLNLRADFLLEWGVRDFDAARIDDSEFSRQPFADPVKAVSGDARGVFDNRSAGSDDAVENRRFSDVRGTDESNKP